MNIKYEFLVCLFAVFFCEKVLSHNRIFEHTLMETQDTARAAAEIANHQFVLSRGTIIIGKSVELMETDGFLKAYKGNVILFNYAMIGTREEKVNQFVIFVKVKKHLESILQYLTRIPYFHNAGEFIIVCTGDKADDFIVQDMFTVCWHHQITNVILLRQASTSISVLTYYPYGPGACGVISPVMLFEWNPSINSLNAYVVKSLDLYPDKFLNLFGCDITFAMYHHPPSVMLKKDEHGKYLQEGSDINLLQILAKHLNMSVKIISSDDGTGTGYYNGTRWSGTLGLISEGRANLTMSAVLSPVRINKDMYASKIYRILQLVWTAPPPSLAAPWTKVIRPFDMYTWLAFLVTYGLAMLSMYAMRRRVVFKRFRMVLGKKKLPDNLILNAWAIITGNPITQLPQRFSAIYFVSMWLLFSFFIRNSYQGALVSIIKKNIYSESLQTIDEAIDAGYSYGGVPVVNVFSNDTDLFKYFREIKETDMILMLKEMSKGNMKFLMATDIERARFLRDVNGIVLDILPIRIAFLPIVFYARRYSPILKAIDRVMVGLVTSGITDRQTPVLKRSLDLSWRGEEALGFANLGCAFILIVLGWHISLITFILEIVVFYKIWT